MSKAENWAEINVEANEGKYQIKHLTLGTIIKTEK